MSVLTLTTPSEYTPAEHALHYEALRQHAMERLPAIARHGLAVLLRQGVAVWIDAWAKLPAGSARSVTVTTHTPRPNPVPEGVSAELVRVLAAMTLGHIQQART
jgi:hypothetical protein